MLTLVKPIELKNKDITSCVSEGLAYRIRDNYQFIDSQISSTDFLHVLTNPPEVFLAEGSNVNILNQNTNVINVQQKKIDVINQLVNRLLLHPDVNFTYQDNVYVTTVLNKLGIKNHQDFINQINKVINETDRRNFEIKYLSQGIERIAKKDEGEANENPNLTVNNEEYVSRVLKRLGVNNRQEFINKIDEFVNESIDRRKESIYLSGNIENIYQTEGESESGYDKEFPAQVVDMLTQNNVLMLHNDIFKRLQTEKIYDTVARFLAPQFVKNELNEFNTAIAEQRIASEYLSIERMAGDIFGDEITLIHKQENRYEEENFQNVEKIDEEYVSAQLVSAMLVDLTKKVYSEKYSILNENNNEYIEIKKGLYNSAQNVINRYMESLVTPQLVIKNNDSVISNIAHATIEYLISEGQDTESDEYASGILNSRDKKTSIQAPNAEVYKKSEELGEIVSELIRPKESRVDVQTTVNEVEQVFVENNISGNELINNENIENVISKVESVAIEQIKAEKRDEEKASEPWANKRKGEEASAIANAIVNNKPDYVGEMPSQSTPLEYKKDDSENLVNAITEAESAALDQIKSEKKDEKFESEPWINKKISEEASAIAGAIVNKQPEYSKEVPSQRVPLEYKRDDSESLMNAIAEVETEAIQQLRSEKKDDKHETTPLADKKKGEEVSAIANTIINKQTDYIKEISPMSIPAEAETDDSGIIYESEQIYLENEISNTEINQNQLLEQLNQIDQQNIENRNMVIRAMAELEKKKNKVSKVGKDRGTIRKEGLEALESPEKLLLQYREEEQNSSEEAKSEVNDFIKYLPEETKQYFEIIDQYINNPGEKESAYLRATDPMGSLMHDIEMVEMTHADSLPTVKDAETIQRVTRNEADTIINEVVNQTVNNINKQVNRDINEIKEVSFIHKKEATLDEEEILERINEIKHTNIQKDVVVEKTVNQTENVINKEEITKVVRNEIDELQLDEMIHNSVVTQMGSISDMVYDQIERRLDTERMRRGL